MERHVSCCGAAMTRATAATPNKSYDPMRGLLLRALGVRRPVLPQRLLHCMRLYHCISYLYHPRWWLVPPGGGGSPSAQDTTMDLGLKLRTRIIYIYIYNFEALEKKLRTLTKGGTGGGSDGA
jgi:hypothetical protein